MRENTIGFRPTAKIKAYIEEQQKQYRGKKKKSKSLIIIEALHAYLTDTNEGNEVYFKYPPNIICPADHTVYMLETLIASCPKCKTRKVCPLWKRTLPAITNKGE